VRFEFAPGFNASILMADGSGFDGALSELENLEYIGRVDRNRIDSYHVRGEADGDVINDLLFGLLIINEDRAIVDVYIDTQTGYPIDIVLTLPDTANDEYPEDTFWDIEIFDINEDIEIDTPDSVDI
jgi:hypothetical protein